MASHDRFPELLAVVTLGAYALIVAGATTAIADATSACPTWPTCGGRWLALDSMDVVIVSAHRLTALVVGLLVLAVALAAWRWKAERRVRGALTAVALLYPVQVALGAITATGGARGALSNVHLLVGIGLFAGLVLALAWELESSLADAATEATATVDGPADAAPQSDEVASETASEAAESPASTAGPLSTVRAYVSLTKPRLMWLLCLVAAAGMALAAGPTLDTRTVVLTLTGGVLAIGASGTFNHVLERDVDQKMARTADRPVPTDQVPIRNAIAFGVALAVLAVATFLQVNVLAAGLGLVAILYYSVVYTLVLKPNTVQNTVIGGFAGSLPALIGWAAATGRIGLPGLVLAGVIFLWTPAHFYNLALAYKEDYARGGFPMLPVVRGERVTRKHILWYLGATLAAAVVLTWLTALGALYAATTVLLGGVFLWAVLRLHREQTRSAAFRAFHASNAYLGLLLVAIVVDAMAV